MSNAFKGRQALQWLERQGGNGAAGLLRQAHDLARLQSDIDAWAAAGRLRLFAGPLKEGRLKLFTDHPAMLARARQQMPSLHTRLNERGWRIESIDLKVRSRPSEPDEPQRPKRGRFGDNAGANWVELLGQLQDERLKEATRRLCERNGWDGKPPPQKT